MKSLIFVITMFLANPFFAAEQQSMKPVNIFPKGEFDKSEMVFKHHVQNFGEVNFGEEYTHYFQFTNKGTSVLKINEVFAGSPTSEVYSFSPEVLPGDTGWVRVRFESSLEIGKHSEFFFVKSNTEGTNTLTRLQIKYELFEYLAIGGDNVELKDKVNIRMSPRLDSPIAFQLDRGESCRVMGDDIGDYVDKFDDSFWFKVENEGRIGWVLSALTEF